jgi:hypothetical protein
VVPENLLCMLLDSCHSNGEGLKLIDWNSNCSGAGPCVRKCRENGTAQLLSNDGFCG